MNQETQEGAPLSQGRVSALTARKLLRAWGLTMRQQWPTMIILAFLTMLYMVAILVAFVFVAFGAPTGSLAEVLGGLAVVFALLLWAHVLDALLSSILTEERSFPPGFEGMGGITLGKSIKRAARASPYAGLIAGITLLVALGPQVESWARFGLNKLAPGAGYGLGTFWIVTILVLVHVVWIAVVPLAALGDPSAISRFRESARLTDGNRWALFVVWMVFFVPFWCVVMAVDTGLLDDKTGADTLVYVGIPLTLVMRAALVATIFRELQRAHVHAAVEEF